MVRGRSLQRADAVQSCVIEAHDELTVIMPVAMSDGLGSEVNPSPLVS